MPPNSFRASATLTLCGTLLAVGCVSWRLQSLTFASLGFPDLSCTRSLQAIFGLDPAFLRAGALWQPFSYAFLHGSFLHLVLNVFALLITGIALEGVIGSRRFIRLFFWGAVAGAVGFLMSLWLDPRLPSGAICVGASGAIAACIGCVSFLAPRARATLWLTIIPVPIRAWWAIPVAVAVMACEAWFLPFSTAYGAHVGGWLAGAVYAFAVRGNLSVFADV